MLLCEVQPPRSFFKRPPGVKQYQDNLMSEAARISGRGKWPVCQMPGWASGPYRGPRAFEGLWPCRAKDLQGLGPIGPRPYKPRPAAQALVQARARALQGPTGPRAGTQALQAQGQARQSPTGPRPGAQA